MGTQKQENYSSPYYKLKAGICYSKIGTKKFEALQEAVEFGRKWCRKQEPEYKTKYKQDGLLTTIWSIMPQERWRETPTVSIWKIFSRKSVGDAANQGQ